MDKVYVVTTGCYSDFRIVAICSNKEIADNVIRVMNCDNDAQEWALDEPPDEMKNAPPGFVFWRVEMDRNGNAPQAEKSEPAEYMVDGAYVNDYRSDASVTIVFHMWATDEKHAIKIANERRIMMLASGTWDEMIRREKMDYKEKIKMPKLVLSFR